MKENPRTYKYEAEQNCSVDNCDNPIIDVEVVLCYKCNI